MRTVGQVLRARRVEKQLSLNDVSSATKITSDYLRLIEADCFQDLSSFATARGFIKNYAEFLGLDTDSVLALFRRDYAQKKDGKIVPQGVVEPLSGEKFYWGPRLTMFVLGALVFLLMAGYLTYQYLSFSRNPSLEVSSPTEGQTIVGRKIEIAGKTDPDALVTVNDNPVLLSAKGEFHYKMDLFPGENRIVIESKSKIGKKTQVERKVFSAD